MLILREDKMLHVTPIGQDGGQSEESKLKLMIKL